ncbi:MAG: ribosome maturation factor RimM [Syntrophaceae bacterium]|nr:ribosome maturation factor RimM [Syntrophaceae bacterium]
MELLEIGKIIRAHGISGRMKVQSYLESAMMIEGLAEIALGGMAQEAVRFSVGSLQPGKGFFILKLKGIEDRDQAEQYRGDRVWIPAGQLRPPPEGEYYWRDIIGLTVVTEEGEFLGRIEGIFPTGSNDVYVCRDEKREILLPAIEECVRQIDLDRKMIVVRLLEGLVAP